MKKILIAALLSIVTTIGAIAVPSGRYYERGKLKAIVDQSGRTIYLLNNDGTVRRTLTVTQENSDGSFVVCDQSVNIVHHNNAWWNENGKTHMNLQWLPSTVTRE